MLHLIDPYLADLSARCSARHVDDTRTSLLAIVAHVPDLDPAAVVAYRSSMRRSGLSARTCNLRVGAARTMLAWAAGLGILDRNPLRAVCPLPVRESDRVHVRRALRDDELARLIDASRSMDRRFPVHQTPFWRTLADAGLRWGEAAAVRGRDVSDRSVYIRPPTEKGRRGRDVPLPPDLADLLADRASGSPDKPLFLSPRGRPLRRRNALALLRQTMAHADVALEDARGRRVDIHALRYTAATRMIRAGVPIAVVAKILGHRDIRVTSRIYTDLQAEDLTAAMTDAWDKMRVDERPDAASRENRP